MARKQCVEAHGLRQAGVPYQLALLALPAQTDPMLRALEAGLLRWHREVWIAQHPCGSHLDALSGWELQQAMGPVLASRGE
jgi:hypothetical protein